MKQADAVSSSSSSSRLHLVQLLPIVFCKKQLTKAGVATRSRAEREATLCKLGYFLCALALAVTVTAGAACILTE